jgi:hypothetical protein
MRSKLWSLFWTCAAGIGLVYFQNCAPPTASQFSDLNDGGQMRISDDWQKGIGFHSPSYTIRNPEFMNRLDGRCEGYENNLMNWQLVRAPADGPAEVLASGDAECDNGKFFILLESIPFESCLDELSLRANVGLDQLAETFLSANCSQ